MRDKPSTSLATSAPVSNKSSLLFALREYAWDHKWLLMGAIVAGMIAAGAGGFGMPFVVYKVFPAVFGNGDLPEVVQDYLASWLGEDVVRHNLVWIAAAYLPLVVIVCGVTKFLNSYWLTEVGLLGLEKMRGRMYQQYQRMSLSYHERNKRGDMLSRLMFDTQFVQDGVIQVSNDLILQPMTLLGAMGFFVYRAMESQQFMVMVINVVLIAACVIPVQRISKRMLKEARSIQSGLGDITAVMQENLASQRDVRAYKLEQAQVSELRDRIRQFFLLNLKVVKWQSAVPNIIEVTSALAMGAALYLGSKHGMTLADFMALFTAMYMCYEPVKKLGGVHNRITMLSVGIKRIQEIIEADDDMPDPEHPIRVDHIRGDVELENVSFGYVPGELVLRNLNLKIPAGQAVGLVGPSGSGKTTFVNLVCRFYDVLEGSVKVDGEDVRNYSKKDLLGNIALVSQHPVLFRGSVADNIRIGKPSATLEEIEEAGKMAAVDSFVLDTENGYNRFIGEGGEGLSGGQKQRVSIARAFLKNAPILILDEATASLDMKSEELIQKEIDQLTEHRTSFVVAHRFSTIRRVDRILVFESGRIVGDGTHEELYESSPIYKDLYDKQIAKEGQDA